MKLLFRRIVDRMVSTCITPSLRRQGVCAETLISKAARFAACEVIEGDYLEFGVYQGESLISSYRSLREAFESRSTILSDIDHATNEVRKNVWSRMRFFGFDSFRGLPPLEEGDLGTRDFKQGMYACSSAQVKKNLSNAGIPDNRSILVEGWFSDTCKAETAKKHGISKASIVWIDGDLYSSTRDVLHFIQDFLQDGTIIIFDDWFSYRGNPALGEQRAFYEWIDSPGIKERFSFHEYNRESWKRMSFITTALQYKDPNS